MAIVTELMPKGNLAQVRALFVLLFVGGGGGIYLQWRSAATGSWERWGA
jgi:hypothetical protein